MMYQYRAKILSVYDGDGVFDVLIDMGLNLKQRKDVRLYGIDAPELRGMEHKAGIVVRDYVREMILGNTVTLTTKKDRTGKYGRLLADIDTDGSDLGSHLINIGFAKPYFGGKKEVWTDKELDDIIKSGVLK